MKHTAKLGLFFLLLLLALVSVNAVEDTQIKELNFFESFLSKINPQLYSVVLDVANPDPNEIITYKGIGTVPSKLCDSIKFWCTVDPTLLPSLYENCVGTVIVRSAIFNLRKELGDTGSPEPLDVFQTFDRTQTFRDFLAKRQTELAQTGSSICGKSYSVGVTTNAPSVPDKYFMFFEWEAQDKLGRKFFVASSAKDFNVGSVGLGTVESDLVVTFTNADGTSNSLSKPQTFVAGETRTVKYNTNKAVSNIGCDTPPQGIQTKSVSSFTKSFTFSFDSSAPSEATLTCRFDSKPFFLYMKKATAGTTPIGIVCGNNVCESGETTSTCVQDCPLPPVTSTDKDNDGVIDSEDKCPDIPPTDKDGNVIPPELNKLRYAKNSWLKGCPLIQIVPNSVRVLGDKTLGYPVGYRVPVVVSLVKDGNFDLTNLSIEAGIYELTSSPDEFSIIPAADVLASRGLQEIGTCRNEDFVQAANIIEASQFSFNSGEDPNEATYILLPKVPSHSTEKTYTVGVTVYKKCSDPNDAKSGAITASTKATVKSPAQGLFVNEFTYHNIWFGEGVTCVSVSGDGEDQCPTATEKGDGTPIQTKKGIRLDELKSKNLVPKELVEGYVCTDNKECQDKGFEKNVTCVNNEEVSNYLDDKLTGIGQFAKFISGTAGTNYGLCITTTGTDISGFLKTIGEALGFVGKDAQLVGGIAIIIGVLILIFALGSLKK